MIEKEKIWELTEDAIKGTEMYIVDVQIKPGNKILILLDSDKGVKIEDCVTVSRYVEHKLDRDTEDFALEVSSYGLDLPLQLHRQYVKNIGRTVDVVTKEGKKITGILEKVAENEIEVIEKNKPSKKKGRTKSEDDKKIIPFEFIKTTKIKVTF